MVVGVHRARLTTPPAGQFVGTVGDYLIEIHVGLGAAAGLPDHQGKLVVVPPSDNLVAGLADQQAVCFGEHTERAIGARGGFFYQCEVVDECERKALAANPEMLQGTLGLWPPERRRVDGDLAKRVPFAARRAHRRAAGHVKRIGRAMAASLIGRWEQSEVRGVDIADNHGAAFVLPQYVDTGRRDLEAADIDAHGNH